MLMQKRIDSILFTKEFHDRLLQDVEQQDSREILAKNWIQQQIGNPQNGQQEFKKDQWIQYRTDIEDIAVQKQIFYRDQGQSEILQKVAIKDMEDKVNKFEENTQDMFFIKVYALLPDYDNYCLYYLTQVIHNWKDLYSLSYKDFSTQQLQQIYSNLLKSNELGIKSRIFISQKEGQNDIKFCPLSLSEDYKHGSYTSLKLKYLRIVQAMLKKQILEKNKKKSRISDVNRLFVTINFLSLFDKNIYKQVSNPTEIMNSMQLHKSLKSAFDLIDDIRIRLAVMACAFMRVREPLNLEQVLELINLEEKTKILNYFVKRLFAADLKIDVNNFSYLVYSLKIFKGFQRLSEINSEGVSSSEKKQQNKSTDSNYFRKEIVQEILIDFLSFKKQ